MKSIQKSRKVKKVSKRRHQRGGAGNYNENNELAGIFGEMNISGNQGNNSFQEGPPELAQEVPQIHLQ